MTVEAAERQQAAGRRSRVRSFLAGAAGVAAFIGLYLFDDILIAWPIAVGAGLFGTWPTFGVLSALYAAVSYGLAMWAVNAYDRHVSGRENRFAHWLINRRKSNRSKLFGVLLTSAGAIGFVISSFALGAIITTFLLRFGGETHRIRRLAVASSLLFGTSFVGFYSGLFRITFT